MRKVLVLVFVALATVLSSEAYGQNRRLNSELGQLVTGAANTLDPRELDMLLSDDFTQAEVTEKGSSVTTKARIVRQLADVPETLKPYLDHVSITSQVSGLKAVQTGDSAVFTANLIARSSVRVSDKLTGKTVTQVERFEISGSAVHAANGWKLTSLRRSRTMAKDVAIRLVEMQGNKAFDAAVVALLLEGAAKAKASNPADFY